MKKSISALINSLLLLVAIVCYGGGKATYKTFETNKTTIQDREVKNVQDSHRDVSPSTWHRQLNFSIHL